MLLTEFNLKHGRRRRS